MLKKKKKKEKSKEVEKNTFEIIQDLDKDKKFTLLDVENCKNDFLKLKRHPEIDLELNAMLYKVQLELQKLWNLINDQKSLMIKKNSTDGKRVDEDKIQAVEKDFINYLIENLAYIECDKIPISKVAGIKRGKGQDQIDFDRIWFIFEL